MWLGEQITQEELATVYPVNPLVSGGYLKLFLMCHFLAPEEGNLVILKGLLMVDCFDCCRGIIAVTQAQRKIPVQYAKRMVAGKSLAGKARFSSQVNYLGFTSHLCKCHTDVPAQLLRTFGAAFEQDWAINPANIFASRGWFITLSMVALFWF